jgi:type I restriction enzyme S subunit
LLTRGIGHSEFKQTEIGPVPVAWEVRKLSEVAQVERGKFTHRPRNDPAYYGGTMPFIQTADVVDCHRFIKTYSQTLSDLGITVSRVFPAGTIVITIAANIGHTGILGFNSCFPDSVVGITPTECVDLYYLEYHLSARQQELDSQATESAQKNINLQVLRNLLVATPPQKEQQEIADVLTTADEQIEALRAHKNHLESLKAQAINRLLTGQHDAARGAIERAEVLL